MVDFVVVLFRGVRLQLTNPLWHLCSGLRAKHHHMANYLSPK